MDVLERSVSLFTSYGFIFYIFQFTSFEQIHLENQPGALKASEVRAVILPLMELIVWQEWSTLGTDALKYYSLEYVNFNRNIFQY